MRTLILSICPHDLTKYSCCNSKPAAPQRYGALNMAAALGPFMMRHPDVKGGMQQFLLTHVFPEFTAPEPYMRSIACEVLGTAIKSGFKFTNNDALKQALTVVAGLIDDAELPVRVHATLALTEMVTFSPFGALYACVLRGREDVLTRVCSQGGGCSSGRQGHPE